MNGQQLLVLGSLVLLSYVVLSFTDAYNNEITASLISENIITGSGIGQSILDEVKLKAFDENTINNVVYAASELTSPASLGTDSESSSSLFDDIDDYNNYANTITTSRLGNFGISVAVYYIQAMSPGIVSTVKTFTKQIDVIITNPEIEGALTMSTIVSY